MILDASAAQLLPIEMQSEAISGTGEATREGTREATREATCEATRGATHEGIREATHEATCEATRGVARAATPWRRAHQSAAKITLQRWGCDFLLAKISAIGF